MHIHRFFYFFLACIVSSTLFAQEKTDDWLKEYIYAHASPLLKNILDKPDSFQYQFIYTRIDRDAHNNPHLKNYYLRVDKNNYFNPASTVKMPLSFLALQKINDLRKEGLNRETPMLTDSSYAKQTVVFVDSSASNLE